MSSKLYFLPLMNTSILIFIFFTTRKSLASTDENFRNCNVTRNCGNVSIKFPFFTEESRCGSPGFNISCINKTSPIFSLPNNSDFIIHNIFYNNQSFRISKSPPYHAHDVCGAKFRSISIPEDRFYVSPNQANITLFFKCGPLSAIPDNLGIYKIICGFEYNPSFMLEDKYNYDADTVASASRFCNESVVYPTDYSGNGTGVQDTLNGGFMLKWKSNNCSVCEASGGKCGFDANSNNPKCFCPDKPYALRCNPENNSSARGKNNNNTSASIIKVAAAGKNSSASIIKVAAGSSIAGIVLLIILVLCFIKTFSFKERRFIWQTNVEGDKKIEAFLNDQEFLTPKRYRYSDVKNITNSFRDKLGKGGYGDVYKGKLLDGRLVAVKILSKSKSNGDDFMNEVASISRTSHVNIVTLFGFCSEGRRRALIYEFVPNGSLDKYIFQDKAADHRQLTWETLYEIAVGIARGLEYLHRGCKTRILHFDIKPHNILLDDNFCPKISDFGLAKVCPEKESAISMTGARGTMGYIAPEVYSRHFGRVSHKSDVYSYGMMILEMVGGRKNINPEVDHTSEIYFPHWIHNRIEFGEELGLQGITDDDDDDDQERVRKMIIVSLWCIQTDPANRPPMSRVVEMMEGNIDSLVIPPKPFLSSPTASPAANSL